MESKSPRAPAGRSGARAREVPANRTSVAALPAPPQRLQRRVVLATTGVIAIGASLLTIDSALALGSASRAGTQRELTAIAQTFSGGLSTADLNTEAIQGRVSSLQEQHGLDRVQVWSVDPDAGEVSLLASSDGVSVGDVLDSGSRDAQIMAAGASDYYPDDCPGVGTCGHAVAASPREKAAYGVTIDRNLDEANEDIARRQRRAAVGVAVLSVTTASVLAWLLRQLIFLPLRRLQFVLRALLAGRLERRVEWHRDDEIGLLAREVDMIADRLQDSTESMRQLALEDELTGLPNRRAGLNQLAAEIASGQREGKPTAVVAFQVDRLDEVRQRWGADGVDETLRKLADAARLALRPTDICARVDDFTFLLILRGADARAAHVAIDRLREVMTRLRIGPSGGSSLQVGVVESWSAADPEELLRRAEEELEASRHRRGRRGRSY